MPRLSALNVEASKLIEREHQQVCDEGDESYHGAARQQRDH